MSVGQTKPKYIGFSITPHQMIGTDKVMSNKIAYSADALIGETPMLCLKRISEKYAKGVEILAKCEGMNPAGSVKDRVAKAMIDQAEREGRIQKNTVLIEPTSGNTGIAIAAIAAMRGYRAVIVMPDNMSKERIRLISAYGAEVVLTDGRLGMAGAIAYAKERKAEESNAVILGQFENEANPLAHFLGTGPEIFDATEGNIDGFVAGVGTGGTITGIGRYLKSKKPSVHIVAVEPAASPILSGGQKGSHGIQGIGAGFVPTVLDTEIYDEVMQITEEDAYFYAKEMAKLEGVLVGISAGAALAAAVRLAQRKEWQGKRIVVLLPDSGERYLSTDLFS